MSCRLFPGTPLLYCTLVAALPTSCSFSRHHTLQKKRSRASTCLECVHARTLYAGYVFNIMLQLYVYAALCTDSSTGKKGNSLKTGPASSSISDPLAQTKISPPPPVPSIRFAAKTYAHYLSSRLHIFRITRKHTLHECTRRKTSSAKACRRRRRRLCSTETDRFLCVQRIRKNCLTQPGGAKRRELLNIGAFPNKSSSKCPVTQRDLRLMDRSKIKIGTGCKTFLIHLVPNNQPHPR